MRTRLKVMGFILVLALSACSTLQSLRGGDANKLRVGTSGSYPPFSSSNGSRLEGIEIDFAKSLANELGRPVEIVKVPFPDLIGELNAGRIDIIMAGMSVTPKRSELVQFTTPYLQVGQMALVRKQDDQRFLGADWTQLEGLRVGFERATTGSRYVVGTLKRMQPVEFSSKEDGLQALQQGRIDVFVHDAPFIWHVVGSPQNPAEEVLGRFTPLTEEQIAWAVRQNDFALIAQLNEVVARWLNSGEIDSVLDKWIKVRKISRPIP